jgi:hypothetical protein
MQKYQTQSLVTIIKTREKYIGKSISEVTGILSNLSTANRKFNYSYGNIACRNVDKQSTEQMQWSAEILWQYFIWL